MTIDERLDALQSEHDKMREIAREAVSHLRSVDPNWEQWYDSTIPDDAKYPEITRLVSERLAELNYMNSHPDAWVHQLEGAQ